MLYSNFVGRIGKDGARVIDGKNGKFLTMDVATDYYSGGENKTMWIRVKTNKERYVEKMAQFLTKGKMIIVEGQQMMPNTWIGKDGEVHSQVSIVADFIDFIRVGKKKEESAESETTQTVTVEEEVPEAPFQAPAETDDELPF